MQNEDVTDAKGWSVAMATRNVIQNSESALPLSNPSQTAPPYIQSTTQTIIQSIMIMDYLSPVVISPAVSPSQRPTPDVYIFVWLHLVLWLVASITWSKNLANWLTRKKLVDMNSDPALSVLPGQNPPSQFIESELLVSASSPGFPARGFSVEKSSARTSLYVNTPSLVCLSAHRVQAGAAGSSYTQPLWLRWV